MAENLQTKVKVRGHLDERTIELKDGRNATYYEMKLSWSLGKGNRVRKSKSTGLLVKGNKTRAENMLAKTIRELEDQINTEREKAAAHERRAKSGTLFADFIEKDWLEAVRKGDRKAVKKNIAPCTFGNYQLQVCTHIAPYFREMGILLTELTADDINEYYEFQYERTVGGTGRRIKDVTVLKHHANIVSSLKYAARKDYIESADSILKNVIRPTAEEFFAKPYGEAEALALIEAVRGDTLELGVILAAYYGLRRSEVVGLRWESIDFDNNSISVDHTVTVAKIDGKCEIIAADSTKSRSSRRTLPLVPIMRRKLLELKAEQEHYRELCGNCYNQAEGIYIYVDPLGNRIKPDYLTKQFPVFLEKNEMRRIRFHDLRHTSARLLLAAGVPLKAIQAWLGHSTFKMTSDLYARYDDSVNQVSANALKWLEKSSYASEGQDEGQSESQQTENTEQT
jgi:integrase